MVEVLLDADNETVSHPGKRLRGVREIVISLQGGGGGDKLNFFKIMTLILATLRMYPGWGLNILC